MVSGPSSIFNYKKRFPCLATSMLAKAATDAGKSNYPLPVPISRIIVAANAAGPNVNDHEHEDYSRRAIGCPT